MGQAPQSGRFMQLGIFHGVKVTVPRTIRDLTQFASFHGASVKVPLTIRDFPVLMLSSPPLWISRSWQNEALRVEMMILFGVSGMMISFNEVGTFAGLQFPAFCQSLSIAPVQVTGVNEVGSAVQIARAGSPKALQQ